MFSPVVPCAASLTRLRACLPALPAASQVLEKARVEGGLDESGETLQYSVIHLAPRATQAVASIGGALQ